MALEVAQEILQQLGGNMAMQMIGGYNLVGSINSLSFKWKEATKERMNFCRITLTPMDTYHVELGRAWGGTYTKIHEFEDVYCDTLVETFEQETGLYLSLHPH